MTLGLLLVPTQASVLAQIDPDLFELEPSLALNVKGAVEKYITTYNGGPTLPGGVNITEWVVTWAWMSAPGMIVDGGRPGDPWISIQAVQPGEAHIAAYLDLNGDGTVDITLDAEKKWGEVNCTELISESQGGNDYIATELVKANFIWGPGGDIEALPADDAVVSWWLMDIGASDEVKDIEADLGDDPCDEDGGCGDWVWESALPPELQPNDPFNRISWAQAVFPVDHTTARLYDGSMGTIIDANQDYATSMSNEDGRAHIGVYAASADTVLLVTLAEYPINYHGENIECVQHDTFVQASPQANISLQPSTQNVGVGGIFEFIVQAEAGGQPVSGISTFIDFDPTYLEVQSVTSGTALPTVLQNTYNNTAGTIDYSAGKLGGPFPTGTFTVATIQFRALAPTNPGTAVTFSTDPPRKTRVDYGGNDVTGTLTGGIVTITLDAPVFLDPASSEDICIGQIFTLEIKTSVDEEQPVSGVQAFIDFDPAYLEVLSVTPGASLPTVLQNTYDNTAGTIDYSAGKLGAPFPTGTFTVATIEFEALAETSGTAVTFSFTGARTTTVDIGGNAIPGIHGDATVEIIPGAIVDISVVLQGGSRPPEAWEVPITIKFFSAGADVTHDTPIYEFHLTTTKSDGTATCQCIGVMPGTYDITAQASNYPQCEEGNCTLTNVKRSVVISAPSTAVDMGTLLAGDANCDGIINISDFGILAVSYMKTEGQPGYDARADFDCNGIINISDFGLLAVNYMRMSPIDVS
jgi:hypothetical protein